jgi:hypothetical protein|tara:strand:+ start:49 stop:459 length:411 start_codon:yes stop_codon:yes gene_type:complete
MATTTATITLSSTDLLSDELALTTSATLTQAGTATGLISTTGLGRTTTTSTGQYTLFTAANFTDDGANKVYLKNTDTDAAKYFLVSIGDLELGRLYAGDFAFFPWNADTGTTPDADIKITPSSTDSMTLEHMLLNQ